jgi:hypothetical protein
MEPMKSIVIDATEWQCQNLASLDLLNDDRIVLCEAIDDWNHNCEMRIPAAAYPNFDANASDDCGLLYNPFAIQAIIRNGILDNWVLPDEDDMLNLLTYTLWCAMGKDGKDFCKDAVAEIDLDILPQIMVNEISHMFTNVRQISVGLGFHLKRAGWQRYEYWPSESGSMNPEISKNCNGANSIGFNAEPADLYSCKRACFCYSRNGNQQIGFLQLVNNEFDWVEDVFNGETFKYIERPSNAYLCEMDDQGNHLSYFGASIRLIRRLPLVNV